MESGYVKVAKTAEIGVGKMKKVTFDGVEILIANGKGVYYVIGSECTHYGGDLSQGTLWRELLLLAQIIIQNLMLLQVKLLQPLPKRLDLLI